MIEAKEAIITAGNKDLILKNCKILPPDQEGPYWCILTNDDKKIVISGSVLIQYTSADKEEKP